MISGGWVLLGIFALLGLPLLIGWLRDVFGLNSNRFYGDELNKKRRSKKEKAFDKASAIMAGSIIGAVAMVLRETINAVIKNSRGAYLRLRKALF